MRSDRWTDPETDKQTDIGVIGWNFGRRDGYRRLGEELGLGRGLGPPRKKIFRFKWRVLVNSERYF